VGFLGVGSAARYHAEALQALGHTVSLGCGRSAESPHWRDFLTVATQASFESDGRSILNGPEIDAVVACLPWNVTESWLPDLLSTDKPVLLEKPVALSSSTLGLAMKQAPATLDNKFVGFNRRFYSTVRKLKERVEQGGLKSAEITVSETVASLAQAYGDEIIDHILVYSSSHILDTATHVLGPLRPVRIYGFEDTAYPRPFTSLSGLLETGQGTPVSLTILADNPAPVGMRLFFNDQTTWHLAPLERLLAYKGYDRTEPTAESKIRRYTPKPFLEIEEDSDFKPGFLAQMRAFTGGEGRGILGTLQESLELLSFTEALLSMATNTDGDTSGD
jgi:predicted dehydrogenase